MRIAQWLGVVGGLVALVAAVVSLVIYGETIPYTDRIGYGIAAFFLAAMAGTGGIILRGRPLVGSVLLVGSSMLGYWSMNRFTINTWYGVGLLVCLIAVLLALATLERSRAGTALQWMLLVVLAGGAVAGFILGGLFEAIVFVALFVVALTLRFVRPVAIP